MSLLLTELDGDTEEMATSLARPVLLFGLRHLTAEIEEEKFLACEEGEEGLQLLAWTKSQETVWELWPEFGQQQQEDEEETPEETGAEA